MAKSRLSQIDDKRSLLKRSVRQDWAAGDLVICAGALSHRRVQARIPHPETLILKHVSSAFRACPAVRDELVAVIQHKGRSLRAGCSITIYSAASPNFTHKAYPYMLQLPGFRSDLRIRQTPQLARHCDAQAHVTALPFLVYARMNLHASRGGTWRVEFVIVVSCGNRPRRKHSERERGQVR